MPETRTSWVNISPTASGPFYVAVVVTIFCSASSELIRASDSPTVAWESGTSPAESVLVVRGLPESVHRGSTSWTDEQWQKILAVFTVQQDRISPTPLLGDYAVSEAKLVFSPRYPLRSGVTYRAILRTPGNNTSEISRDFALPPPKAVPATRLTAIYPTRDVLPENLLKFYLHFSAPMSRGEVYQRVRLLDQQGRQVESPFLELAEELWSPDGMRLTLYFDPGRIKRGLKPRELFGPALLEGHSYTLEVAASWPDANGQPLSGPKRIIKSFRVTAPDDQQPDAKHWKVIAPPAGSRRSLTVAFDEPLDSAMLIRVLAIRDQNGKIVAGDVEIGKGEASWSFRPATDWLPGEYHLVAATALEDLAGNSLGRPFEVDVFRPATTQFESATDSVSFRITPSE